MNEIFKAMEDDFNKFIKSADDFIEKMKELKNKELPHIEDECKKCIESEDCPLHCSDCKRELEEGEQGECESCSRNNS